MSTAELIASFKGKTILMVAASNCNELQSTVTDLTLFFDDGTEVLIASSGCVEGAIFITDDT